jgi:hypothetical protein
MDAFLIAHSKHAATAQRLGGLLSDDGIGCSYWARCTDQRSRSVETISVAFSGCSGTAVHFPEPPIGWVPQCGGLQAIMPRPLLRT